MNSAQRNRLLRNRPLEIPPDGYLLSRPGKMGSFDGSRSVTNDGRFPPPIVSLPGFEVAWRQLLNAVAFGTPVVIF